jgi:hypothetical protein
MLKVGVDQGSDYLDYLLPFVLQILVDKKPDPVTDRVVRDYVRTEFGLEIPERAIQVVLKRLSRKYPLKKSDRVYRIMGEIPNPEIFVKRASAAQHIQAVVAGLIEFSRSTARPISNDADAVDAICAFLVQFNIPCLRAYLRGTAIPAVESKHDSDVVLVSQYVIHLQKTNPERFHSLLIMLQGHMLANALLCPDLQFAPKTYKGMTFYLDTPLLVRRLGVEGEPRKAAIESLISLLRNLGATVAAFSHSRNELEQVLKGAADYINAPNGRGAIVTEARRSGITKSDLLVLAGEVSEKLAEAGIAVKNTPRYDSKLQIDELAFEQALDDEVSYFNERAKEYDVNSVRSIYVLRGDETPSTIEKAQAALVTSNAGFARAAYEYGQRYEQSREVSSVITDFSLANMAWLKAPMGAPNLPTIEVLAFSYAALQPSRELLDKYLKEIDKLEEKGKITERDHQLLRSSTLAQDELMKLTLGDDEALTEGTVIETLERVSSEMKKEESEKLSAEQAAHRKTQDELLSERELKRRVQERLYWRCRQKSKWMSWTPFALVLFLLIVGLLEGLGLRLTNPRFGSVLALGSGVLLVLSFVHLLIGTTLTDLQENMEERCLAWLLKWEAAATGLELADAG